MLKLKLKYLGTAAAEGWPALFCTCESCKRAATAGGRNIRTRSQAVIDDKLLIDFPADTFMHVLYGGLDLTKISNCIITHSHGDHLYPADFEMRKKPFAYLETQCALTVYGTESTGKKLQETLNLQQLSQEGIVLFEYITPFEEFNVDEYVITPLKADHDPRTNPVIYIISDAKKTILYGNDTGYFPQETWDYLEKHKPHFDFVSLDCTVGFGKCRNNHMDFDTNLEVKERFIEIGCADKATIFCVNHFSHNGKVIYDEMVPIAQKAGFLVSYDTMEIEI